MRLSGVAGLALVAMLGTGAFAQETSFAYINKLDDNAWFVNEVAGAQDEAAKLGVTLTHQGVQSDSNKAMNALETAIAAGVKGVIIVVPDQAIGPAVLKRTKEAGIPVIAVDDGILDEAGAPAPFVGFEAKAIGTQVGDTIVGFHKSLGWGDAAASDTFVLSIEVQGLSVCMDRNNAANDVLKASLGITDAQIIHIPYDPGSLDKALSATSQTIVGIPQAKRFLIDACNDDGVLGAVRALEQAGVATADIIGVGINGQMACEEFKKAEDTGLRASVYVDSRVHGATAVRLMNAFVAEGAPIPERTIIDGTVITKADNKGVAECQ
ncbi:MAG: substrate-binding domain-containing protein [Devosia sp.]|uniref:substrate-binding domain-containing protein n=1 Tax=Devosia sp. TaxID=1871048 RepID=UPI001AC91695|nr:substrate-binding domain-containing protein [Devosia sp.]MBN9315307.1 substrate-binding domain-containing protein [Devosia sp.]